MNEVLIVWYSRSGTTRNVARRLHQITGWPAGEVRDLHVRTGFIGAARCVVDSLLARSAPYRYLGPAAEEFDRIAILCPIWLDGLAAPMRAFVRDTKRPGRKVALIGVTSRHGAFRANHEMTTLLGAAPAPVLALTPSDILSSRYVAALRCWTDAVSTTDAQRHCMHHRWLDPESA